MTIHLTTGSPASGMTLKTPIPCFVSVPPRNVDPQKFYSAQAERVACTPPAENDDAPRVPPGADSGQGVCMPYSVVYCTQPELGLHGASHVIPVATSREVGDLVHKLLSQGFGPLSVGVV